MTQQLNIIGGFYADEARPWTQQDICNYIPFRAEQAGTLSPVIAVDAPGLRPFVEIASNGGIRGMENVEGKLLVVAGTELYQISNTGVAIPRGTIPGTGLVSIGYNQAGIANEVLIGNGSAGYVYNTATLTLTRITDEAFPGTKAVDYLDSYLLGVEPLGRFWFHSDLADASSYNSLDRYESETSPDRIVTLAVSNEEAVVFNQKTTDFFVNTGAATGTFQSKGVSMTVGCASANSVVKLDNTLFWLDNFGVFQRLNGYSPQPVSTRVIESAIAYLDWSKCTATVYQDRGRKIVYWTFPTQWGLTIGYDVTTGMWHRREAYGLTRDRLSCIVNWNRKWLAGDYINGRIYELDWDYMLQVDQPHVRKVKTAPLTALRKRVALSYAELVFDTGGPETIAESFPEQPAGPTISGAAPDGTVSVDYAGFAYTVTAGAAPIASVVVQSGSLPTDITINASGVLSTTAPTDPGTFTFTLRVTDTNGLYADHTDTIFIQSAWEWVQNFGNDLRAVASDDSGHFIVAGNGVANVGELWLSGIDAGAWTQIVGHPVSSIYSIAWGRISGIEYWVAGSSTSSVLVSSNRTTWTANTTASGNAVLCSVFAGTHFIRAGFAGAAEYASNPAGTWAAQSVGVVSDVNALVADPDVTPGQPHIVCAFLASGAIRRTINGGATWSAVTISGANPHAALPFYGGAATIHEGAILAYKYVSSVNMCVYRSVDHGATFTATTVTITPSTYNGYAVASINGAVQSFQDVAAAPDYIQMVQTATGLTTFVPMVLATSGAAPSNSSPIALYNDGSSVAVALGGYSSGVGFTYRLRYEHE